MFRTESTVGLACLLLAVWLVCHCLLPPVGAQEDGPFAYELTDQGELLPRYRPPGYRPRLPCPVGWTWDKYRARCSDVDECATTQHECRSERVHCVNTLGSYRCRCHSDFTGDPYTVGCKTVEEFCQVMFRDADP